MVQKVTAPQFVSNFRCTGAECADTCCQGWNMQVEDAMREAYKANAPELLDALTGNPGEYIMRRDAKTDYCVKFTEGLCGIQKKYGEAMLGEACALYPRVTRQLGTEVVMTAALSCPEVARLSLFDDAAFTETAADCSRLPYSIRNYLPDTLSPAQAMALHRVFIHAALDAGVAPERVILRILTVSESLERISWPSWPDAAPFYLEHADSGLQVPEPKDTDQVYLLQALCGLVVAAKKVNNVRLMYTISEMERALHVAIRKDNLAIMPLPDSGNACQGLIKTWQEQYKEIYIPILRRYLAMQLSLALFPFGGFGGSLPDRAAIIGIRFATVKLALMSACALAGKPLEEREVIRVIQSLSRFLDHLSDADFSLQIYRETGWLKKGRLRALLGE